MSEIYHLKLSDGTHYPYQVINSNKAKYIRIKLSRRGDLSVTLPAFTELKLAHEFVHTKTTWIEKNLSKVSTHSQDLLPERLNLMLINEVWTINYIENNKTKLTLAEDVGFELKLSGEKKVLREQSQITDALNQWCKRKAKTVFPKMLEGLAERHGFHYRRLSIRSQKTRWGSCSQNKNINLNAKLLFMPKHVVEYVMIHELCHTLEMNHSARFWSLVEECDPQYKTHRKALKKLGHTVVI